MTSLRNASGASSRDQRLLSYTARGRMDRAGTRSSCRCSGAGSRSSAAPLPLTSLSDDAAALRRVVARTTGPVILAGHAYAGAVIAAVDDEPREGPGLHRRRCAPDEGEPVAQVFYRDEPHSLRPEARAG